MKNFTKLIMRVGCSVVDDLRNTEKEAIAQ